MQALRSFMTCNCRTLSLWERHFPVFQFHRYSAPRTRNTCGWCCWEATFHLLQPEERLHPGHAAQSWPASGAQGRQAGGLAAQEMTSLSPGGLRLAGWGWGGRCRSLTFHWGLGYRKPMNLHGRVKNNWPGLEATEGTPIYHLCPFPTVHKPGQYVYNCKVFIVPCVLQQAEKMA